ncbi:TadE/TadG family type IV pilus assembly protein [Edaphosphingomonas haloaromaticamans]|uniref:TadE-like domain-containing protein n=1 Tax=Edaphosphingomonas haloaromaticamans TaxID=653954 RepID=A0A1S1H9X4_9SPHN|nr:hypothetical protein BHE75_00888 [Sphingomonas haloaromaticamans]
MADLSTLHRSQSGVAMTEFAFVLPLLLLLGLAGIETANYAIAHLRISQIAMATADNAARVRDSIDEYDINELFIGAKLVGQSIDFADHGRIILSSVEPRTVAPTMTNGKPNQWIRWQRCFGMKQAASSFGAPRTKGGTIITNGSEADSDATKSSDQAKSQPEANGTPTPTGIGPANNQIGASPGTALMFVEVVYDYQPLVPNSILKDRTIRYTSAFNVRQRSDQVMKTGGIAAGQRSTCNRYYS